MLEELRIRGLGVIDDAVLPLGPGLTVVTGETGAGKTMVVTGLQLLFGGRGDATRVRAGQELAIIDGRLLLEPESVAARRVADAGGELDADNTLVLPAHRHRGRAIPGIRRRSAGTGVRARRHRSAAVLGARPIRPAPADPPGRAACRPGSIRGA